MADVFLLYALSILMVILGFIALLKQKIYLDSKTREPVSVEIPIIGKIKTNYPALIFVFLGFCLAFFVFNKSYPHRKVDWYISGSFVAPDGHEIDWTQGTLSLFPCDVKPEISDKGRFEIAMRLDEAISFEDFIQKIDYSHPDGSQQISPETEFLAFHADQPSLLEEAGKNTRDYKPIKINVY